MPYELEGVRQVFATANPSCLPNEVEAIEMLRLRFKATFEYGQAEEYEFATKARDAGCG
jgi:hypothetical protein